jgi:hypothetical protein
MYGLLLKAVGLSMFNSFYSVYRDIRVLRVHRPVPDIQTAVNIILDLKQGFKRGGISPPNGMKKN